MRRRIEFLALWTASVAASAAVQHHWLGVQVDAAFLLLATVSSGLALACSYRLPRQARERAGAELVRDQQLAFLVTEAVRQRRALDRVERAGLVSTEEIEALENQSASRCGTRR